MNIKFHMKKYFRCYGVEQIQVSEDLDKLIFLKLCYESWKNI